MSQIEYVKTIGKKVCDPRSQGNFSKALRKIIEDHKNDKTNYV